MSEIKLATITAIEPKIPIRALDGVIVVRKPGPLADGRWRVVRRGFDVYNCDVNQTVVIHGGLAGPIVDNDVEYWCAEASQVMGVIDG
ncbi:MAG: hypothetical protein ACK53W_04210 [Gemmatimonadota bacterium]